MAIYKPCLTYLCANNARQGKSYCHKCRNRKYRQNNPLRTGYHILKHSAKKRGISFELTFKDYEEFVNDNPDYLLMKGLKGNDLTIDRVRENEGYKKGNLQILTRKKNTRKYHLEKQKETEEQNKDLPF